MGPSENIPASRVKILQLAQWNSIKLASIAYNSLNWFQSTHFWPSPFPTKKIFQLQSSCYLSENRISWEGKSLRQYELRWLHMMAAARPPLVLEPPKTHQSGRGHRRCYRCRAGDDQNSKAKNSGQNQKTLVKTKKPKPKKPKPKPKKKQN